MEYKMQRQTKKINGDSGEIVPPENPGENKRNTSRVSSDTTVGLEEKCSG
jgi:hypothetical protein